MTNEIFLDRETSHYHFHLLGRNHVEKQILRFDKLDKSNSTTNIITPLSTDFNDFNLFLADEMHVKKRVSVTIATYYMFNIVKIL